MNVRIIDNFFDYPDKLRIDALQSKYNNSFTGSGWLGHRSYSITTEKFSTMFTDMVHSHIPEIKYDERGNVIKFFCCFHYTLSQTKLEAPFNFDEYKIHSDGCEYAGVVYLTPNPPTNSGTSFYNEFNELTYSVENKFNRLICYPGTINHAPTDLFGDSQVNGRLVLTFFSDPIIENSNIMTGEA